MEPTTLFTELVAELVYEERQLDGSRHIEIVGADDTRDVALRLVINRDGDLAESELNLESGELIDVLTFASASGDLQDELLQVTLRGSTHRLDLVQREDGDVLLTLHADSSEMSK